MVWRVWTTRSTRTCLRRSSSSLRSGSLKYKPSAEADAALAARRAGDLAEGVAGRGAEGRIRIGPAHGVGHVVGVDAELREAGAADGEALEQRTVQLPEARALGAGVAFHVPLHAGRRQRV